MKVFYDTEFLEAGGLDAIRLISIGAIAEDGREFYAIDASAPWTRISDHRWLMENVIPHLPGRKDRYGVFKPDVKAIDVVMTRQRIKQGLYNFLRDSSKDTPLELWADYAAYDHVVLAQVFGRMVDLPDFVPMFTNDLRQEWKRLGSPPEMDTVDLQERPEHNALNDAWRCRQRFGWLEEYANELRLAGPGEMQSGWA